MLTYLLEKLDKIKKDHALYCSNPKQKKKKKKIPVFSTISFANSSFLFDSAKNINNG